MAGWKGLANMLDGPRQKWVSFRTCEVDEEWKITPCNKVMLDGSFELAELELICEELRNRLEKKKLMKPTMLDDQASCPDCGLIDCDRASGSIHKCTSEFVQRKREGGAE